MPELKEVFDMVTRQTEPEVESWREQERRQRRTARNRKLGAFVSVGAMLTAAAVFVAGMRSDGGRIGQPASHPLGAPEVDSFLDIRTGLLTPLPEEIIGGRREAREYAVSPDASTIAYAGVRTENGEPVASDIFVADADGENVRRLTSDGDSVQPVFSPDGEKLAFLSGDGKPWAKAVQSLYVVDLASGSMDRATPLGYDVATDSSYVPRFSTFSPDGTALLFSRWNRELGVQVLYVPVSGGRPEVALDGPGREYLYATPSFSPDATTMAFGHWVPDSDELGLWLADSHGRDRRPLVTVSRDSPTIIDTRHPLWGRDGRILYLRGVGTADEIMLVDPATGRSEQVGAGFAPVWFDTDTLIVESDLPVS